MHLNELCRMQIEDDERRGFAVRFATEKETHAQLIKDLVGLFSEMAEFSDVAKKIGLRLDHPQYAGPTLAESRENLGSELADIFIYAIRLSAILEIDLESALIKKIKFNKNRYEYLSR